MLGVELLTELTGAGVLPDDGVVHRLAGLPVPDHRGLALVGDPECGDVLGTDVRPGDTVADDPSGVATDLLGVMLHPPRLGEDLPVLQLTGLGDRPGRVEDDRPGRRGALVDGQDVALVAALGARAVRWGGRGGSGRSTMVGDSL